MTTTSPAATRPPAFPRRRTLPGLGAAALLLAACGGGGGEDETSFGVENFRGPLADLSVLSQAFVTSFAPFEAMAATLRNTSPAYLRQRISWSFETRPSVVYNSYALAASRFEYAHSVDLTGAGQIVSVVDDGFLQTHEAIAGAIRGTTALPVASHGTAVASIIAGDATIAEGQTTDFIGVAPRAELVLGTFEPRASLGGLVSLRRAAEEALAVGAVAQNNSWGYPGLPANRAGFDQAFASTEARAYLGALTDYAQQGVVVFAAPNSGSSATIMDGLPLLRPELEPGWLSVINAVPTFNNDRVTSARLLSAPCAGSARWCLAAEGVWDGAAVRFDDGGAVQSNTDYGLVVGTSFAAPQVSGALALLAEAFPNLTPHDLRIRLLASADMSFFRPNRQVELAEGFVKGYSTTWGHGFLDVRAALLPIGTPAVAMADGTSVTLDQPLILAGSAMGDAVTRSLGDVTLVATDLLGGDFRLNGGSVVAEAAPRPIAPSLLNDLLAADPWGASVPLHAPAGVLASLGGREMTLRDPTGETSATVLMPTAAQGDAGLSVSRLIDTGAGALSVGVTLARDGGSLFGLGLGGAAAGSDIAAIDLGLTQEFGTGGYLRLGASFGAAEGESSTMFNALSLELGGSSVAQTGDRLALGVSLPLAATSGRTEVALPVARGASGMIYHPVSIDFAPEDRQIDLSVSYDLPIGRGAGLRLELRHALNHGHVAGQTDTAAGLAFRISF